MNFRAGVFLRIFAGSPVMGSANGSRSTARFYAPYALTMDQEGALYIADQADNRIRKISASGLVSTVAGSLSGGYRDGSAVHALFDSPSGIAIDKSGTLFIADQENNSIRKIYPNGVVETFAGSRESGYVNGRLHEARFKIPAGICMDARGVLYVADRGNHRIRKITAEGEVSTLAGNGEAGFADGNETAAKFNAPTGIAVDSEGFVYVTDLLNNRIRKISPKGEVQTLAGNGEFGKRDGKGNQAAFRYPTGIALDQLGGMYVTDQLNHIVRRIDANGYVSTITYSSPDGFEPQEPGKVFKNPMGICLNKDGNLIVADYNNHNIKEISVEASLTGVPAKTQLGMYDVVLRATDQYGSSIQESQVLVTDSISPVIIKTTPADKATGVSRTTDLKITFDEEIKLGSTGALFLADSSQTLLRYDLAQAFAAKDLSFSSDFKSILLKVKDLPAGTTFKIALDEGVVSDRNGNPLKNSSASQAWSFTTRPKEKQLIPLEPFSEKVYGERVFALGPLQSSAGLAVKYFAEDPSILQINGDSAKILRAGNTKVVAVQTGNADYMEEKVDRLLIIHPRELVIRPVPGQSMEYSSFVPPIKFELVSGSLIDKDSFKGSLQKAAGDTVGFYPITLGTLSPGENYTIKFEGGIFEIKARKATLAVKPPVSCTNLISANGDGINDKFIVRNIDHYPGNELSIADRSGAIIFKQKNYANDWDGTYKGSFLPVGTYYYMLDLGNQAAKIRGHISVVE